MKYAIVTKTSDQLYTATQELEAEVEKLLKAGWKLQGGVNIFIYENHRLYVASQALYK